VADAEFSQLQLAAVGLALATSLAYDSVAVAAAESSLGVRQDEMDTSNSNGAFVSTVLLQTAHWDVAQTDSDEIAITSSEMVASDYVVMHDEVSTNLLSNQLWTMTALMLKRVSTADLDDSQRLACATE
ncbi:MAG: hypothetical protein ACKPKO_55470, partial [Candidatus Fonsibacter sp.]